MLSRWSQILFVGVVGAFVYAASISLFGHSFEVSDYQPQGGDPPIGGSTTSG